MSDSRGRYMVGVDVGGTEKHGMEPGNYFGFISYP